MSEMTRPVLGFADVMYPGLRNKKVSECTPEESIVAGIAWMADNSEYGIDDAARKLIVEFRAFVSNRAAGTKCSEHEWSSGPTCFTCGIGYDRYLDSLCGDNG
jgi:hypothetical protein